MMRLFVAISIPERVADNLWLLQSGVPGARWMSREQLHLTLRFIGEVDGRDAAAIDDALSQIRSSRFILELKGVGEFGGKTPRALWAGVAADAEVAHLQRKIESALQRIGIQPEERKFKPHVTLARLKATAPGRVVDYLSDHSLYASGPFEVSSFILFSSNPTSNGSLYRAERSYGLG